VIAKGRAIQCLKQRRETVGRNEFRSKSILNLQVDAGQRKVYTGKGGMVSN